jgi:hypothetical protein
MCSDHPGRTLTSPGFWAFPAGIAAIVVVALVVEQLAQHRVRPADLWAWLWRTAARRPRGAPLSISEERRGARGWVTGDAVLRSPLGGRACLAWSATVLCDGQVLLRDGRASDFSVALEDGSTVAIAAGPVEVVGKPPSVGDPTRWLDRLLPERAGRENDPFPWDQAYEIALYPGDSIDVEGELSTALAEDAPAGSYRQPPATVLRPLGRVVLRVVR